MGLRPTVRVFAVAVVALALSAWWVWAQDRPVVGSPLAMCQVQLSVTQEDLAIIRAQMGNLQTAFDVYRVQTERARLTPQCAEGQRWDWTRHEETRQPIGCVDGVVLGETALPE